MTYICFSGSSLEDLSKYNNGSRIYYTFSFILNHVINVIDSLYTRASLFIRMRKRTIRIAFRSISLWLSMTIAVTSV